MPKPAEPCPSRELPEASGIDMPDPGRAAASLRWATWLGVLFAAAAGHGCPMDMDPPDDNDDDQDGIVCDLGAAIGTPTVSFANDLVPLFENSGCLSAGCHGGTFPSSGYSLADYESAFEAGDDANEFEICPIVPGDPENSYLVEKISPNPRTGARMPFLDAPLTEEQIELVRTWINEGAPDN